MRAVLGFGLALAAAPAVAGLAGDSDPRACVADAVAANTPVAACVEAAQIPCFSHEPGSAAGIACFVEAQDEWTAMIAARMGEIRQRAPEGVSAVAGIEVKHDVLHHLNECDRIEARAIVADTPSEQINWQKARCVATGFGLTFVKLMAQSQAID